MQLYFNRTLTLVFLGKKRSNMTKAARLAEHMSVNLYKMRPFQLSVQLVSAASGQKQAPSRPAPSKLPSAIFGLRASEGRRATEFTLRCVGPQAEWLTLAGCYTPVMLTRDVQLQEAL